jgi:hypothetical protein
MHTHIAGDVEFRFVPLDSISADPREFLVSAFCLRTERGLTDLIEKVYCRVSESLGKIGLRDQNGSYRIKVPMAIDYDFSINLAE